MKKWKGFLSSVLLIAVLFSSCNHQHVYDPTERVVLSANSSDVQMAPNFDLNLLVVETIAEVAIVSDGEVHTRPMWGFDEYPPEERPKLTYTEFEVSVKEVWQGESIPQNITLHILGDLDTEVTKPQKGDQLVLFLKCVDGIYYLIDYEYSIFAINPGDTMYAFGDKESFICYDNDSSSDFREAIQEKYNHIGSIYEKLGDKISKSSIGPIAETYMNSVSSDDI